MRATDRGALILGAAAGASAWISLGAVAVTNGRLDRVGVVPPLWLLAATVSIGIFAAWITRLRRSDAWPLALSLLLWLPWLPIPIVSPLTIWEGPLEPVIWLAAVGGALFARASTSWTNPAWASDLRRAPIVLATLAFTASIASAVALADLIPGGDEPHYLIIAQSLLNDGDLRIQNNHDRGDYLDYYDNGLPPDFLRRGRQGEIYSIHAPGVAVLILPVFMLAGYPGSLALIALLVAAALGITWRVAREVADDSRAAWAGAVAVGLSATVFLHSFSIFPDPVGWAFVSAGMLVLVRLERVPADVRRWEVALAGALIGLLPWLHTRFAVIAGAFGVVFAARLWMRTDRWRWLIAFAAAPLVLAATWFGYFWIIYGTPDPSAPYGTGRQSSLLWAGRGLVGLAFDQEFGLVANAPALALLPFGWLRLFRLRARLAIEFLVLIVPYVLVVASFGMWWGGWSAPARFLLAVLPFAVPLVALVWRDSNTAVRNLFIALVLIGIVNVVVRVAVLDGALLHNSRDGYDLLLDWLSRAVNLPLGFPAVHRKGGLLAMVIASIWLAAGLVTITLLSWLMTTSRSRGAQWTLTVGTGTLLATVALIGGWRVSRSAEVTPESSQVDFLRRWQPERRPLALRLPGLERPRTDTVPGSLQLASSRRPREFHPDSNLLTVAWLPAGDYAIELEGDDAFTGALTVSVGMTSLTIDRWVLDGLSSGATSLRVGLPALAHSLVVRGDEAAARRLRRVWLRPLSLNRGVAASGEYITRASRYQQSQVFLLDDEVYMEPTGLWTRGHSVARIALTSERAVLPMDLQAGPVRTAVRLESGSWSFEAALAPGERRRADVPAGGVLTVRTIGSFRPVDSDPTSRDGRALGVRLEFP